MKINVEVDCTPAEARAFLGLPDVTPLNDHLVAEMQKRMDANMAALAPEELMKTWTSFDPLAEGELIALRADGSEVRAPQPGYIVFPDHAALPGHEWFYMALASTRPL